jgi:predicted transcriptional regulator
LNSKNKIGNVYQLNVSKNSFAKINIGDIKPRSSKKKKIKLKIK